MTQELFCLIVGLVLMVVGSRLEEWTDFELSELVGTFALGAGFLFFCYGLSCGLTGYASHLPSIWGGR